MILPPAIRAELEAHAAEIAPDEACGLLVGHDLVVSRLIRCTNAHPRPRARFLISGYDQLRAFRAMRDRGEALVGIYHSHPTGAAVPSPSDLLEIEYPDALTVILSLRDPVDLRAYRVRGGKASEVVIRSAEGVTT